MRSIRAISITLVAPYVPFVDHAVFVDDSIDDDSIDDDP